MSRSITPPREATGASASDSAPFAAALVALRPKLQRYARSLARDADMAEDLVQDTLLRAWNAQAQYAADTNLQAWTFTILRNLFLSARRRDRFHGEYDELAAERIVAVTGNQDDAIDLANVTSAMATLPDDQREALQLVAIAGLTTDEVAVRLGAATGTGKSRVSRARTALRLILSQPAARPQPPVEIRPIREPRSRRTEWRRMKAAGLPLVIGL